MNFEHSVCLCVLVSIAYWLSPVDTCHAIVTTVFSTSCQAIPTSTTTTGSTAPSITYSTTNTDGTTHPDGSFAVITCENIGSSTLLTYQLTTNAETGALVATCSNGAWSNPNTFTCVTACNDLECSDSVHVTYTNGHQTTTSQSLPGATATVTCVDNGANVDMFEGTDTSYASPKSSPQTYTCSTSGNWQTSSGTTQTSVKCLKKCNQASISVNNPQGGTLATVFDSLVATPATQSTGQTFTPATVTGTAAVTVACTGNYGITITNNNGDGTHTQTGISTASPTFTCYDGNYNATITDATAGSQTGAIQVITCA